MTNSLGRGSRKDGWSGYFCLGLVAVFLAGLAGRSVVALGLAGLLALVPAEANDPFAGDLTLAAALAGRATDAISADAGLPAGFGAVFPGASD